MIFFNSNLKYCSSYTWRSIWSAKKVVQDGLNWRVGNGESISIFNDVWISGSLNPILNESNQNCNLVRVAELINVETRSWKEELIT